jgi:hypothetical protein
MMLEARAKSREQIARAYRDPQPELEDLILTGLH